MTEKIYRVEVIDREDNTVRTTTGTWSQVKATILAYSLINDIKTTGCDESMLVDKHTGYSFYVKSQRGNRYLALYDSDLFSLLHNDVEAEMLPNW